MRRACMHLSRRTLLAGAMALVGSLVLASGSTAAAAPWTTFKTVVTNLKNPRGVGCDAAWILEDRYDRLEGRPWRRCSCAPTREYQRPDQRHRAGHPRATGRLQAT